MLLHAQVRRLQDTQLVPLVSTTLFARQRTPLVPLTPTPTQQQLAPTLMRLRLALTPTRLLLVPTPTHLQLTPTLMLQQLAPVLSTQRVPAPTPGPARKPQFAAVRLTPTATSRRTLRNSTHRSRELMPTPAPARSTLDHLAPALLSQVSMILTQSPPAPTPVLRLKVADLHSMLTPTQLTAGPRADSQLLRPPTLLTRCLALRRLTLLAR